MHFAVLQFTFPLGFLVYFHSCVPCLIWKQHNFLQWHGLKSRVCVSHQCLIADHNGGVSHQINKNVCVCVFIKGLNTSYMFSSKCCFLWSLPPCSDEKPSGCFEMRILFSMKHHYRVLSRLSQSAQMSEPTLERREDERMREREREGAVQNIPALRFYQFKHPGLDVYALKFAFMGSSYSLFNK